MPANSLAQTEPKCGSKSSNPFTLPQQQALRDWNEILSSINLSCASDNYLSPQVIADNRMAAFQLFRAGHNQVALSDLADAFKTTRGHWVNGELPAQSIPMIIAQMNDSLLESTCRIEHYQASFVRTQGDLDRLKKLCSALKFRHLSDLPLIDAFAENPESEFYCAV